jgi:ribose 5-phosphate isomerase B
MRLAIGSDHAGLHLKAQLAEHMRGLGHDVVDVGPHDTTSVDYPDYAHALTGLLSEGAIDRGVLICGTGLGMSMAANKRPGVRAAVVSDEFSARMAMQHNDARVLCIGERVTGPGLAMALIDAWLGAEFEGGRHARRVGKIEAIG